MGGSIYLEATTSPETLLTEILHLRQHGENASGVPAGHVMGGAPGAATPPTGTNACHHSPGCHLIRSPVVRGRWAYSSPSGLAAQGANHLVLTGRSGITTAQQQAALNRLAANGVTVQLAAVDVTDESAMRALFAQLAAHTFPLQLTPPYRRCAR